MILVWFIAIFIRERSNKLRVLSIIKYEKKIFPKEDSWRVFDNIKRLLKDVKNLDSLILIIEAYGKGYSS